VSSSPPPLYSPAWPRYRRLAMTGSDNPNYVNGRHSRYRRRRLEAPLVQAMRTLNPGWVLPRLPRLPEHIRTQVNELLGWLTGVCHPDTWALRDLRPGKSSSWYVPRAAWAFCAAWLRKARAAQRLVALAPSLIASSMPSLLKRGERGQIPNGKRSARDEVERLRAWCHTRGVAFEGGTDQT